MNLLERLILTIRNSDDGFLDNTIVNRICRSLFCRHRSHQEPFTEYSKKIDMDCRELLEKTLASAAEYNTTQTASVKLLVSLLLNNPKCSEESLQVLKQILSIDHLLLPYVELTNQWLNRAQVLEDLNLFRRLYDRESCEDLRRIFDKNPNIHLRRLIAVVLSYAGLLGIFQNRLIENNTINNDSILFLLMELKLQHKLSIVSSPPIEIPVLLIQLYLQNQPLDHGARILFLLCCGAVRVQRNAMNDFKVFLINLPNWIRLCTQTVCEFLLSEIPLLSPFWNFILSSWLTAINCSLSSEQLGQLYRDVKPIIGLVRSQRPLRLLHLPEDFVHNLLINVTRTFSESTYSSEVKCGLWYLLSVILTPFHPKTLNLFYERLCSLGTNQVSTMELEAMLCTSERLCAVLTDAEKILTFVRHLNQFADSSTSIEGTLILLRHSVGINSNLVGKMTEDENLKQSCSDRVLQCLSIMSERFPMIADHASAMEACSTFYAERFLSLMETALNLSMKLVDFSVDSTTPGGIFRLLSAVERLIKFSTLTCTGLHVRSDLRLLFAIILINQITLEWISVGWDIFIEQTVEVFNELLNFDVTEVSLPFSATEPLIKIQEKLGQAQPHFSEYHQRIIAEVNRKMNLLISMSDISHRARLSSTCPECNEVLPELIHDVRTAHPGQMIDDCTEG